MLTHTRRAALILGATAFAAMPAAGIAYTLCGYTWSIREVPYYINPKNADVSESAAIAALQTGADAWSIQSNADFSFYYMGRTAGSSIVRNGKNEVFFRDTNPGPIAEAYRYYATGGEIVEFDIVFYDGGHRFFTGGSGCDSGYYIEDTATHEFGHALGLKHSDRDTATMWYRATRCGTWKRSLDPDDIAGVEAMYPASGANAAPSVTISSPTHNGSVTEGTTVTFAASASDKEDGNLSAKVSWRSSIDGALGTGSSLSQLLSAGTHTIKAEVTDSDGARDSHSVTFLVAADVEPNSSPTVSIAAPANETTVPYGTALSFSGSASDVEDGNLTSKLVWSSNLDGPLGMGGTVNKVLSAGTHTVVAAVTDSAGAVTRRQVTVNVVVPSTEPVGMSLSATGYKKKGIHHIDLKWTGATSTKVDVYRDGVRVSTTANDGAHIDVTNIRGGASYAYRVCEAGTTTCSNGVVVRF